MKKFVGLTLGLVLLSTQAVASVSLYTSRAPFEAQGTIVENYGFEDQGTGGFGFPGDPWLAHDVLYTNVNNLLVNSGYYGTGSTMMSNNYWTPNTGVLNTVANYGMFGFDFGMGAGGGQVDISLTTNVGSYTFANIAYVYTPDTTFFGWVADSGEYFVDFTINALNGGGNFPLIDNVTLGNAVEVPAPGALALLGLGLAGLGIRRRRSA